MNGLQLVRQFSPEMPQPQVTPEQILEYGNRQSRPLLLDVNVIAYFGQLFQMSSLPRRRPPVKT